VIVTDLWQSLVEHEKGTTLPALLARFIEAYECGPNRAEYLLTFKHLLGRNSEAVKQVNNKTSEALASSDKASEQEIFEKTLHAPAKFLDTYENLLKAWYLGNSSDLQDELTEEYVTSWEQDFQLSDAERESRGDLLDNTNLRESLERDADFFEHHPDYKRAVAEQLGVDSDVEGFDLALRRYQATSNDLENRHFSILKEPRVTTFWAKEVVGMLPLIAERSSELASHPIARLGESIPESLRVLFEQANLCYLFDFDIPCVVTCGSLLEDAFKRRFPDLAVGWENQRKQNPPRYVSLLGKANDVASRYPRSRVSAFLSDEYRALWEINDTRRDAVHDPGTYLAGGKRKSEEVLRKTRDILEILFDPEVPQ